MGDIIRGLLIGIFVGLFAGLLIGATVVGLIKEYAATTVLGQFLIAYGQVASTILGGAIGAVASYRMLQNLQREQKG